MPNLYGERLPLDAGTRADLPGEFITLRDGVTHYEIGGTADSDTPVVLVHGFTVPSYVWQPTFEALTGAGFRVMRYDLFGRGTSDRPRQPYSIDLYDRQLDDLITELDLPEPVDLFGLSMGGMIVPAFAVRHPERVRRIGLIDPAGLPNRASTLSLMRVPLLGEVLMARMARGQLASGQMDDFYDPSRFPDYVAKFLPQTTYRGFHRAILSTVRHMVLDDFTETFRQMGRLGKPTLLIWGRHDLTIPFPLSETMRALLSEAGFHAIEEAGHLPHYEQPQIVNPLIIDFLRRD